METTIYSNEGKSVGSVKLPESVFGAAWNADLVHQVVTGMQANARLSSAHTKDRSEVSGGGKKPWKQKGTGRARHGSTRSPIWSGGGVAHGPRNSKDYSVTLTKKMKAKALASVLSKKFADQEILALDAINLDIPKTATIKTILKALADGSGQVTLATKRKNAAVVVIPRRSEVVEKSFRNFGHVEVVQAKDVNPVDLLTYKFVVLVEPNDTLSVIEKRVATSASKTK
jgi:large subunit ribosomal protein L4